MPPDPLLDDIRRMIEELPSAPKRPVVLVVMPEWPDGLCMPVHDEDGRLHDIRRISPGVFNQIPRVTYRPPKPGEIGGLWGTPVLDWS